MCLILNGNKYFFNNTEQFVCIINITSEHLVKSNT